MTQHPLKKTARFRPCRRAVRLPLLLTLALGLAGCAGQMAYREGSQLVAQDHVEAGLVKYREALAADPTNVGYKSTYLRVRDEATNRLLSVADRELAEGKPDLAVQDYQRVLAIDPVNDRARDGLRSVEADRRHVAAMADARAAFERKEYEAARVKLDSILTERPTYEPARQLLVEVNEKRAQFAPESSLDASFRAPISLEFRDAPLKQIFEVIARHSGLNFLFDKDVKTDQRASVFLKNSTVEAAIFYLLMSNQLERQVMDVNTILIYPDIAAKQKEYQEMTIKTFYLANAEAKNVATTLKTILKSRDVVVDEKLNLIILRDSPDAVKLASQLVALQDVAEPEVMLDVEVLEVQRSRLLDLGVDWPTSLSFAPLANANNVPLTIEQLHSLNRTDIGVTGVSATITAKKTDGEANTLANPRIRVRNKEKAKVVIGDKLPTITTTISSGVGGFASESVNYVDVGLKLDVEPTVYLNNEVGIRISLEVSNLVDTVTTKGGTTAYRIGTRSASTMLQLKDGENQVLAGLIKNEERNSGSKLPVLGDVPLLGRLFGSQQDTRDKTEVVLSITPHLIRNLQRPPASSAAFSAGTETSFRRQPDTSQRAPARTQGAAQPAGQVAQTHQVAPSAPGTPVVAALPAPGAPGSQPVGSTQTVPAPVTPANAAPVAAPNTMMPATSVNMGAVPSAPALAPTPTPTPTPQGGGSPVEVTPIRPEAPTPLPVLN